MTSNPLEQVLFEVKRTIVGQDLLLERMAIAMLAGGHLLVEGVPGLAKTLAVKSLAGDRRPVPAQPVHPRPPADLVGTLVYRQHPASSTPSAPSSRTSCWPTDQPRARQGAERSA